MVKQVNKLSLRKKIPQIEELIDRFSFIDNETLRNNISISFQYIIFLITLLDELDADNTTVSSSMHKDMIVHTGTIIESCLHFCLKKYIDTGKIKSSDVMPTDWATKDHKLIYKISEDEQVCGVIKYKKTEHLTDQTPFVVINRACKKTDILTESLFLKAEKIREMRNKIHISGLKAVEDDYDKNKSQEAFDIARSIIETVETKLLELASI